MQIFSAYTHISSHFLWNDLHVSILISPISHLKFSLFSTVEFTLGIYEKYSFYGLYNAFFFL